MNPENNIEREQEKFPTKEELVALAKEFFEKENKAETESIVPFSGIKSDAYVNHKAGEAEYGVWTTPIDKILERFKNEGVKVDCARSKDGTLNYAELFAVPAKSSDIVNDSIPLRQLVINETLSEDFKELILEAETWYKSEQEKLKKR
ncbi:MAG: hypothetical protein ACHQVK_00475 [Candidatus Paceibacterales bacterium]